MNTWVILKNFPNIQQGECSPEAMDKVPGGKWTQSGGGQRDDRLQWSPQKGGGRWISGSDSATH